MHKYTNLKIDELRLKLKGDREKEWQRLSRQAAATGRRKSGAFIMQILEVGFADIDSILDSALTYEKLALSKEGSSISDEYLRSLHSDLSTLIEKEIDNLSTGLDKWHPNQVDKFNLAIDTKLRDKKRSLVDSISHKLELLKEEMRLNIGNNIGGIDISINGDVAVLNTGTVYGDVYGKIKKLSDATLSDAFSKLLDAIKASSIDDNNMKIQMQNVEYLAEQCTIPKDQRNLGVINTILNAMSLATNIATSWAQYGPLIIDYLVR